MVNTGENVFERSLNEKIENTLEQFFDSKDYAESSRRAIRSDLFRFGRWYISANNEPLDWSRVVTRDIADFREHMVRVEERSISTTNRCLVMVRQVFAWLVHDGQISSSPAKNVKELRRQPLSPKGLSRSEARKILREAEARQDYRAIALFHVMLYCGVRVSELQFRFSDLELGERTGWLKILGKGGKQRMVPIPLPARRALAEYIERRPPVDTEHVFVGERGMLTDRGVRNICRRYSAITGLHFHPHALRHTFAKRFLDESQNDLVSLAAVLGHESLETTRRYVQRQDSELAAVSELVAF